jgi:hypothetical protein
MAASDPSVARFAQTGKLGICAIDFGPDFFAYWIGTLSRDERNKDGSLVTVNAWGLERPSLIGDAKQQKSTAWRERAIRAIVEKEPAHALVNLYDTELQNPMGVEYAPGKRRPGNAVTYGMSRSFAMYIETKNEQLPQDQHKHVVSTHPVQKFNTFGVHLPCVGSGGQRKYRRKRASVAFVKSYLRHYPNEGKRWLRTLEQHKQKQDDLADVFWAGLSRAVRVYRQWSKKKIKRT